MIAALKTDRAGFRLLIAGLALAGAVPTADAQGPRRPPPGFRPPPRPPVRGPVIVNNVNNGGGSGLAAGAVGFGIGMLAGAATSPRPAPNTVVVAPPASSIVVTRPATPVMVAPAHPQVIVTQPAPPIVVARPTPPPDAITEALKMLNGKSYKTRRDGAMLLGRLRNPAAVGPLMDRLRNDKADAVRKSAAWALAEIGDTAAIDYLEKAAQFDDDAEVRAAARTAQQRLLSRIALATPLPANGRVIEESISPPVSLSSTPVPPPAPMPGASAMISSEKAAGSPAPRIVPAAPPSAKMTSPVLSSPMPTTSVSPFVNAPALPAENEPPLRLSPPVKPLEVP